MNRLVRHFRVWNIWRKRNGNGRLHHFLVLVGLIKSPSMGLVMTEEEIKDSCISFITSMNNTTPTISEVIEKTKGKPTIVDFAEAVLDKPLLKYQKRMLQEYSKLHPGTRIVMGRNGRVYIYPTNEKDNFGGNRDV